VTHRSLLSIALRSATLLGTVSIAVVGCSDAASDAATSASAAMTAKGSASAMTTSTPSATATASAAAHPKMMEYGNPDAAKVGTLAPDTGIAVGQKVPDIQVTDLDGKDVKLSELYAKQPILLSFYRGGWCPFCNFEIHEMTKAFPEYQKLGVLPVAVSVDKPDQEAKMKATYDIPFPVLSDSDAKMIEAFHVVNKLDDAGIEKMKGFGVDLESYSGKAHHEIAIPSFFLIDKTGTVRWAHSDPDFKVRPTTAQLLAAIEAAKLAK